MISKSFSLQTLASFPTPGKFESNENHSKISKDEKNDRDNKNNKDNKNKDNNNDKADSDAESESEEEASTSSAPNSSSGGDENDSALRRDKRHPDVNAQNHLDPDVNAQLQLPPDANVQHHLLPDVNAQHHLDPDYLRPASSFIDSGASSFRSGETGISLKTQFGKFISFSFIYTVDPRSNNLQGICCNLFFLN